MTNVNRQEFARSLEEEERREEADRKRAQLAEVAARERAKRTAMRFSVWLGVDVLDAQAAEEEEKERQVISIPQLVLHTTKEA